MEKYFKIGQKVWYVTPDGNIIEGVIEEISENSTYPILCKGNYGIKAYFTQEGKLNIDDDYISLFQEKPIIKTIDNQPLSDFEKGEPVFVLDSNGYWQLRIYSRYDKGLHRCFDDQKHEGSDSVWINGIRKFSDNPLLKHDQ